MYKQRYDTHGRKQKVSPFSLLSPAIGSVRCLGSVRIRCYNIHTVTGVSVRVLIGIVICLFVVGLKRERVEEKGIGMGGAALKETFYISHGSPTLSIDESLEARHFLKDFKDKTYSKRPSSILVISGHWETDHPTVNLVSGPSNTIYDFYGFPKQMYKFKYPAPGAPELAKRVKELLVKSGIEQVNEDKSRGLDHGAWVPLMLMYPEADIPVCQLSIQPNRDGTYHYNLGRALAPLKDEGVLIVGSGATTHNLRALRQSNGVASWALEFDTWLKESLLNGRYEDVNHYEEKAPHGKMAHPWPDHFYPLHVAMGAAGETSKAELIHHSWSLHSLSYASYKFTATP